MAEESFALRDVIDLAGWYEGLLCRAFPPSECKPLGLVKELIGQGRYRVLGLYEGERLLGCAALWGNPDYPDWVLLDYLAVDESRRNHGLGREILRRLPSVCGEGQGIVLESESPVPGDDEAENALRRRRIGFYERCGFHGVYEMATCGARFQAMVSGEPPKDPQTVMEAHRGIYGPARVDVVVPLPPGMEPPKSLFE